MHIHKLDTTSAFIAIDLDATVSSGPVRWARKILQGGAQDLARSQTFTYAALEMRRGGASAGINAEADDRGEAVAAFVEEMAQIVEAGTYLPDAAKGVSESDLSPLRPSDPRATSRSQGDPSLTSELDGIGAAVAADTAVGLDGRTVAIEGFGESGPSLARAMTERGASIVSLSTTEGAVSIDGVGPDTLAEGWAASGPEMVGSLGEVEPAWKVFATGADILCAGSKMGAVNHETAGRQEGTVAVVPTGRLPFTAKALAVFRRSGVAALPDFVTLAGSSIALWAEPELDDAALRARVVATIESLTRAAVAEEDGPFLGACYGAESFLRTWQETLPFGRPLAP